MRIAYFDCFAGISGDRLLGALLDAGLPLSELCAELGKLPLEGVRLEARKVTRADVTGTSVVVIGSHAVGAHSANGLATRVANGSGNYNNGKSNGTYLHKHANGYVGSPHDACVIGRTSRPVPYWASKDRFSASEIVEVLSASTLPDVVKQTAISVVKKLSQATSPARDGNDAGTYEARTIVEIVGAIAGLALLGISRVECSPLNIGGGTVGASDGLQPALSPAAAAILCAAHVPIHGSAVNRELVDPVGAAIITTIASAFSPMPVLQVESVGHGVSSGNDSGDELGLLRVVVGQALTEQSLLRSPVETRDNDHAPGEDTFSVVTESHQRSGRHRVGIGNRE